jgi:hypothetical protein
MRKPSSLRATKSESAPKPYTMIVSPARHIDEYVFAPWINRLPCTTSIPFRGSSIHRRHTQLPDMVTDTVATQGSSQANREGKPACQAKLKLVVED